MGNIPEVREDILETSTNPSSPEPSDNEDYQNPMEAILQYRKIYEKNQELLQSRRRFHLVVTMWRTTVESLGTVLRLLAPSALLTLICGHDSFIVKLLHQCDRAIRSILFPTPAQTDGVLQWLQETLPGDNRIRSLDAVWEDGSILCDVIESVIPGSCSGHTLDERTDLTHGQRLAEQYLGVSPIFSQEDLSQRALNTYQECRLTHYLGCIKEAMARLSPPVSRAGSPLLQIQAYTLDYVARGMGLITAYKNRRAVFYIYPTAQQSLEPGDIYMQIKGPGNSYGSTTVPVIYGRAHMLRTVLLNLGHKPSYNIQLPLPMTHGPSYMRSYDKMHVENSYFIPKIKNDIDISIAARHDRVKASFIPAVTGFHELSLTSKGCHVVGSPFALNVEIQSESQNEDRVDSLDEDIVVEECPKGERKVVFRIVDFVTEKMLLTEDGKLEKISEEEANALLHSTESLEDLTLKCLQYTNKSSILPSPDLLRDKNKKQNEEKQIKVITLRSLKIKVKELILKIRVCKQIREMHYLNTVSKLHNNKNKCLSNNASTPDIVNSTRNEAISNDNSSTLVRQRSSAKDLRDCYKQKHSSFKLTTERHDEDNPYFTNTNDVSCDLIDKQAILDDENSITWETTDHTHIAPIEIVISSFDDDDNETSARLPDTPPLILSPLPEEFLERPKTPVFKILDEDVFNEFDLFQDGNISDHFNDGINGYLPQFDDFGNENYATDSDIFARSISPSINFQIGAPVTPTPMNLPMLETDMDSIILASNLEEALEKFDISVQKSLKDNQYNSEDSNSSIFTTPLRHTPFEQMTDSQIIKMYEEPLPYEEFFEPSEAKTEKSDVFLCTESSLHEFNIQKGEVAIKTPAGEEFIGIQMAADILNNEEIHSLNDMQNNISIETWDSAYISIDEINSSPETNANSPRSSTSPRVKLFSIEENEKEIMNSIQNNKEKNKNEYNKTIGPAEHEIWKSITKENEENCHLMKQVGAEDFVTFPTLPNKDGSLFYKKDVKKSHKMSKPPERSADKDGSASDGNADVKRSRDRAKNEHTSNVCKEKISSVQTKDAESNDASQRMQNGCDKYPILIIQGKSTDTLSEIFEQNISPVRVLDDSKPKKKCLSQMVSEKKEYWDEKIELIKIREEKRKHSLSRKKCSILKRNDSLNKKRGKNVLTKMPSITEKWKQSFDPGSQVFSEDAKNVPYQGSLVARWKQYWNDKVEKSKSPENDVLHPKYLRKISPSPELFEIETNPKTVMNGIKNEELQIDLLDQVDNKNKHAPLNTLEDHTEGMESFCNKKYNPKGINLSKISERINRFMDSVSPIIECEESRFSTPEIPFGGMINVSNPVKKTENDKNVSISKDIKHDLPEIPTPEALIYYEANKHKYFHQGKTKEIQDVKFEPESEADIEVDPQGESIKTKINNIDKREANKAREAFVKNRSNTIDIPKIKIVHKLRKYFSMDNIEPDSKFTKKDKLAKSKNIDLTVKQRKIPIENDFADSNDSIPTISERKAKIEKHLQNKLILPVSKTKMENKNSNGNVQLENNNKSKIVRTSSNKNCSEATKNTNKESSPKEDLSVCKKPIVDIVAAFENRRLEPGTKEQIDKKTIFKKFIRREDITDQSPYTCFGKLDADKGKGTTENHNQATSLSALDGKNHEENGDSRSRQNSIIIIEDEEQKEPNKYKERFQKAKNFFQTLDKFQNMNGNHQKHMNECEKLLHEMSERKCQKPDRKIINKKEAMLVQNNSFNLKNIENNNLQNAENGLASKKAENTSLINKEISTLKSPEKVVIKPARKIPVKAHSAPTSDTENELGRYEWRQGNNDRLIKISEKYLVEDLFKDVAGESNKSRIGSFKGIPHKRAVLAAFRSMESVTQPSSYEYTISQMEDFAKKNGIVNAQTYHSEFPQLPITDPDKYRTRCDVLASGLVRRRDVMKLKKPRRYSAPDSTMMNF